jgi:hypothetical protein
MRGTTGCALVLDLFSQIEAVDTRSVGDVRNGPVRCSRIGIDSSALISIICRARGQRDNTCQHHERAQYAQEESFGSYHL